jgi:hypothetical protein
LGGIFAGGGGRSGAGGGWLAAAASVAASLVAVRACRRRWLGLRVAWAYVRVESGGVVTGSTLGSVAAAGAAGVGEGGRIGATLGSGAGAVGGGGSWWCSNVVERCEGRLRCVGDGGENVGKLLEGSSLDECGRWNGCCVGGVEESSNEIGGGGGEFEGGGCWHFDMGGKPGGEGILLASLSEFCDPHQYWSTVLTVVFCTLNMASN